MTANHRRRLPGGWSDKTFLTDPRGDNTDFCGRIHGKLSISGWKSSRCGVGPFGLSRRIDQKYRCLFDGEAMASRPDRIDSPCISTLLPTHARFRGQEDDVNQIAQPPVLCTKNGSGRQRPTVRGRTTAAITCRVRAGILNQTHIYVNVPDDGFRRQRVFFVLVDRLTKTLCS